MSQSPVQAQPPPLPPRPAPVPARSCQCQVRGPEPDVSLWRAPGEGAQARVPRGAGAAGKVEAEHRPVPTVLPGWGGWGAEAMWVGVRE